MRLMSLYCLLLVVAALAALPLAAADTVVNNANGYTLNSKGSTRQNADGQPLPGWHREQAMSLEEAFRCATLDAAYAGHQEKVAGSLEPGKWADFIVIDRDLFKSPAADIHKTRVLQTWVAGRAVHQGLE